MNTWRWQNVNYTSSAEPRWLLKSDVKLYWILSSLEATWNPYSLWSERCKEMLKFQIHPVVTSWKLCTALLPVNCMFGGLVLFFRQWTPNETTVRTWSPLNTAASSWSGGSWSDLPLHWIRIQKLFSPQLTSVRWRALGRRVTLRWFREAKYPNQHFSNVKNVQVHEHFLKHRFSVIIMLMCVQTKYRLWLLEN